MKHLLLALLCLFILCGCPKSDAQVPVTLAPDARQQFFSASGAPLANGCLFTYNAGTSTPAATYTDGTGLYTAPNPIILDGGGFATIWLASQSYRFVLFTSGGTNCATGAQQWLVDGVNPPPFLGGNNAWTGANSFSGTTTFNGLIVANAGGTLTGTFGGNPVFSGNPNFSGMPTFTNAILFSTLTSLSSNPALTGQLQLASGDTECWRNNADNADLCLAKSTGDIFSIGGDIFAFTNVGQTFTGSNTFTGGVTTFSNSGVSTVFDGNLETGANSIISEYNGLPTNGNGVAVVREAPPVLNNLTADANLAAYTAEATPLGLYLITVYEVITTAASSSSALPNFQVTYTDATTGTAETMEIDYGNGCSGTGYVGNAVGNACQATGVISARGGTAITIGTNSYSSTGATKMAFSLQGNIVAF